MLDLGRQKQLGPALMKMMLSRNVGAARASVQHSERPLFVTSYAVQKAAFLAALERSGATSALGGVHVYQLRHGGASRDFVTKSRSLEEVRRRGRWRSWASVRRYENGSRVAQMLNRLPPSLLDRAMRCADSLGDQVCGRRLAEGAS